MFTYLIINCVFLVIALSVYAMRPFKLSRAWWLALLCLLVMTAVFDSLLIQFDIVQYDTSKLLGWYIWRAPIEDFFYSLVAALIIPALWNKKGSHV